MQQPGKEEPVKQVTRHKLLILGREKMNDQMSTNLDQSVLEELHENPRDQILHRYQERMGSLVWTAGRQMIETDLNTATTAEE